MIGRHSPALCRHRMQQQSHFCIVVKPKPTNTLAAHTASPTYSLDLHLHCSPSVIHPSFTSHGSLQSLCRHPLFPPARHLLQFRLFSPMHKLLVPDIPSSPSTIDNKTYASHRNSSQSPRHPFATTATPQCRNTRNIDRRRATANRQHDRCIA